MSVNEQFAGSSAEFTQIRRASPASKTARLTAGIVGRGDREPGVVEIRGLERPLRHRDAAGVGPGPDLVADRGGDHVDLGAGLEQRLDLAGRDPAGADDHAPPVRARAGSPGTPTTRRRFAPARALTPPLTAGGTASREIATARLVEGEDLQLDREVDLAQRDAVGDRRPPPARS